MIVRVTGFALLLVVVLAVVACGSSPNPSIITPDCQKHPVHVVLHFDETRLWGTDLKSGRTVAVIPRSDAHWRVDVGPPRRLVDSAGRHVGFDGDIFYQACIDDATGSLVVGPDDLPSVSPGGA